MQKKLISPLMLSLIATILPGLASGDPGLIRTSYALDEPRGYCIDIPGFGPNARLDAPLQLHTCKFGASLGDQVFDHVVSDSSLRAPDYDVCLEANALEEGAQLLVSGCDGSPRQRWSLSWGRLSPESNASLCVTAGDEAGGIAGTPPMITPVYRHREVTLAACSDAAGPLQTWHWSSQDARPLSAADVARAGMPEEIAAALASIGRTFNGDVVRETAALYAGVERSYDLAGIDIQRDVAYGPHERQRFDIHRSSAGMSPQGAPVIVLFHGGGLVGGTRQSNAQAANYFASLGYIGVNATYRFAPDHVWPAGAQDVGNAVTWLRENVADYGGDPDKIFVMGLSSGALHSATYVFMPDVLEPGTARPAGAILMSGPYTFDFANPTPGEVAYFGEDASRYAERVVVGNVSSAEAPVLFMTAEFDIDRYTVAFSGLMHELMSEHGISPRYAQSLGHNHTSQMLGIGSSDTSVSEQVVDFVERTVGR